mgnify:CR=1 FL=1
MQDFYTKKEKEILSYLSKQNFPIRKDGNYSVTKFLNLQFSKTKKDETWFEINRSELVDFLKKRNNNDFSLLDKNLIDAGINSSEVFYVSFY